MLCFALLGGAGIVARVGDSEGVGRVRAAWMVRGVEGGGENTREREKGDAVMEIDADVEREDKQ